MGEPRKESRPPFRWRAARRPKTVQDVKENTVGGSIHQTTVGGDQHTINIHFAGAADEEHLLERVRRVLEAQHRLTPSEEHLPGPPGTSPQPGPALHPKPIDFGAEAEKAPTTSRGLSRRTVLLGGGATLAATASALVAVRLTGIDGRKVQGPKPLSDLASFREAGFTERIDAVMQTPDKKHEYWVFSDSSSIIIEVAGGMYHLDRLVRKPMPLSDWGSLRTSAPPFTKIDAVARTPDKKDEYWVFSGSKFMHIRVNGGKDHIVEVKQQPMPLSDWGGLGGYPNFEARIDAVMQMPDDTNEYLVFSGGEYIRTSWSGSGWSVT